MYLVPFESWIIVTLNHEGYRRQAQEEGKGSKIATQQPVALCDSTALILYLSSPENSLSWEKSIAPRTFSKALSSLLLSVILWAYLIRDHLSECRVGPFSASGGFVDQFAQSIEILGPIFGLIRGYEAHREFRCIIGCFANRWWQHTIARQRQSRAMAGQQDTIKHQWPDHVVSPVFWSETPPKLNQLRIPDLSLLWWSTCILRETRVRELHLSCLSNEQIWSRDCR